MTEIQNDLFGIKWPTGVDMPLNKTQTQTQTQFLSSSGRVDTAVWMHYLDANKTAGEARRQLHKNVASNIEQVLAATPHKAPSIRLPCLPSRKLSKLNEPDTQDTAGEAETSS